jgi:NADPH:quinone reductase-like Zn-dependent oxidoreductase
MKAVLFDRYGPPDVLRVADVERPVPRDDQVLVRVRATTATRSDCGLRGAEYLVGRLGTGLLRPRRQTIGMEFAGEVEAVGAAVTAYAPGDRVFGVTSGANAEYVCAGGGRDEPFAPIPDGMPYEQAAALGDGGLSAISLLRAVGLQRGERVVVNGASGSIGVGGVQIGKHLGAHVTAVCAAKNAGLMRELGADEVVDYESTSFARTGETYDVIFDAVGKASFLRCRRALAPDGRYVTTDPGFLWHDAFVSLLSKRARLGIVRYTQPDLDLLVRLVEAGEYRAVVDRTYPLADVAEAHRYVETHQKTGNVVLLVP